MKTLVKDFGKRVRPYVAGLVAMGIVTVFPSWTADGGKGKEGGKGGNVQVEAAADVMKAPVEQAIATVKLFEDPGAVWFEYTGPLPITEAHALEPSNYTLRGGTNPPCLGSATFCGVKAPNNGFGEPNLTSTQAYTAVYNYFNANPYNELIISERN